MRKITIIALIILFCIALEPIIALAHSGGTDFYGGHMDHATGDYHYHHGYPAHDHENGVCPYKDGNRTYTRNEDDKAYNRVWFFTSLVVLAVGGIAFYGNEKYWKMPDLLYDAICIILYIFILMAIGNGIALLF